MHARDYRQSSPEHAITDALRRSFVARSGAGLFVTRCMADFFAALVAFRFTAWVRFLLDNGVGSGAAHGAACCDAIGIADSATIGVIHAIGSGTVGVAGADAIGLCSGAVVAAAGVGVSLTVAAAGGTVGSSSPNRSTTNAANPQTHMTAIATMRRLRARGRSLVGRASKGDVHGFLRTEAAAATSLPSTSIIGRPALGAGSVLPWSDRDVGSMVPRAKVFVSCIGRAASLSAAADGTGRTVDGVRAGMCATLPEPKAVAMRGTRDEGGVGSCTGRSSCGVSGCDVSGIASNVGSDGRASGSSAIAGTG